MKTDIETLEDSKVRLHVEVDAGEFDKAIEATAGHMASHLKVPGFRKGKVPLRVLEARVGRDAITDETVREALPGFLAEAVLESGLDVIGRPDVEKIDATESNGLTFDAVLEVRPDVEIEGWEGLEVEVPPLEISDSEIDEQIDAYRRQSAPIESVTRPATEGDFVLIDLKGSIHDEEVDGANLSDFLYEVGSGSVLNELDNELGGKRTGDILKFNAVLPDSFADQAGVEAMFSVMVKDVRERILPDLDDNWVDENTEFDTIDEMKADLGKGLSAMRRMTVMNATREGVLEGLAKCVTGEMSDALVGEETAHILEALNARLQSQGLSIEAYMQATGKSIMDLAQDQRETAEQNVRADLALRAIARTQDLKPDEDELAERVANLAERSDRTVEDIRKTLDDGRGWTGIETDIIRHKALDLAVEKAILTDENGTRVEWSSVVGMVDGSTPEASGDGRDDEVDSEAEGD